MTKQPICHDSLFFSKDRIKKDLKKKSVQSAFIKMTTSGITIVLNMTSIIVLARLLLPEEFGLLAMVTALTGFASSFRELGLGAATVQREEITHDEVSKLFWINSAIGIAIMLALIALSPIVVWFYGDTRLLYICMVLSSVFPLAGLTVQHRSILERQMRFGYLGGIKITSTILGLLVAIPMALHGYGVWALVSRDIISVASYGVGTWILCRWRPSLPKWKTDVKSSLRFGGDITGLTIIQYFTMHLDRLLIGRFFGASSLGLYSKAFQLAMMPMETIGMIFWDVGFSPLSALQRNPERFRQYIGKLLSVLTFFFVPIVVIMVVMSEDVIRLLLGEAWLSAVPIFRIIAIAGFAKPIETTIRLIMISYGKSSRCIPLGLINGVLMITAFAIGIRWGNIGVAYGYLFASYATLIVSLIYCLKDTPVNPLFIFYNSATAVISSCGAGIILVMLLPQIPNTNTITTIVSSMIVISVAYLGIMSCIPKGRQILADIWSYRTLLFTRG